MNQVEFYNDHNNNILSAVFKKYFMMGCYYVLSSFLVLVVPSVGKAVLGRVKSSFDFLYRWCLAKLCNYRFEVLTVRASCIKK